MVYDIGSVPLSTLSNESRNLLSSLLNTKKSLPNVGPDEITRHRDWRGLASLANITYEQATAINECNDKTDKVIELWVARNDGTATVGRILQYLTWIDRYDVYDDIVDLARSNKLIGHPTIPRICNEVEVAEDTDEDVITFDDKKFGTPQRYHAYVLFAREDKDFVDELLKRTRDEGFKICTEDEVLPGHSTKFEPVARLISERCRHIVLVYSPDFLKSPAINFCANLAQADGITKKQHKIIPIMYRDCNLPSHLRGYHSLRYSQPGERAPYDFWRKLSDTLETASLPRSNQGSQLKITEVSSAFTNGYTPVKGCVNGWTPTMEFGSRPVSNSRLVSQLALPSVPLQSVSMGDLRDRDPSPNTRSLSPYSDNGKKKTNPVRKLLSTFRRKKHKTAIVVDN